MMLHCALLRPDRPFPRRRNAYLRSVWAVPGGGGSQLFSQGRWTCADLVFLVARRCLAASDRDSGPVGPGGTARGCAPAGGPGRRQFPGERPAAKLALRRGFDVDLPSGLLIENESWEHAAYSEDRREGIAAFVGRQEPRWPSSRSDG